MARQRNLWGNRTPGWGPELGPIARHAPGLSIELLLFQAPAWARLFLPGAGHGTGPGSATRQELQPLLLRARAWNGSEGTVT
jgi:hypothetical protein